MKSLWRFDRLLVLPADPPAWLLALNRADLTEQYSQYPKTADAFDRAEVHAEANYRSWWSDEEIERQRCEHDRDRYDAAEYSGPVQSSQFEVGFWLEEVYRMPRRSGSEIVLAWKTAMRSSIRQLQELISLADQELKNEHDGKESNEEFQIEQWQNDLDNTCQQLEMLIEVEAETIEALDRDREKLLPNADQKE